MNLGKEKNNISGDCYCSRNITQDICLVLFLKQDLSQNVWTKAFESHRAGLPLSVQGCCWLLSNLALA